ncbi:high mobility group box domain-containing protein [Mycena olivaceomarginata]|nr:high mobility group box domain-containing protein [Mycena olivaceomarginata]
MALLICHGKCQSSAMKRTAPSAALFLPLVMSSTIPAGSGAVQSTFGIPCTPPRRALNAYMFFSQEWRDMVRAENPDASFGEIGKLLGAKWKELDDEERKPYNEQAAKDKTRAEEEMRVYDDKIRAEEEKRVYEAAKDKAAKDKVRAEEEKHAYEFQKSAPVCDDQCTPEDAAPRAPLRALSAYMFFSQEWRDMVRAENPDVSFGEIRKLLGAKWKELDDEERKPYVEQAAKDKTREEEEKRVCELSQKSGSVCDDE